MSSFRTTAWIWRPDARGSRPSCACRPPPSSCGRSAARHSKLNEMEEKETRGYWRETGRKNPTGQFARRTADRVGNDTDHLKQRARRYGSRQPQRGKQKKSRRSENRKPATKKKTRTNFFSSARRFCSSSYGSTGFAACKIKGESRETLPGNQLRGQTQTNKKNSAENLLK